MGGGGSALAAAPATVLGATTEANERTLGMKKILDGSVSQQVAEHAGRPVPIVPPR